MTQQACAQWPPLRCRLLSDLQPGRHSRRRLGDWLPGEIFTNGRACQRRTHRMYTRLHTCQRYAARPILACSQPGARSIRRRWQTLLYRLTERAALPNRVKQQRRLCRQHLGCISDSTGARQSAGLETRPDDPMRKSQSGLHWRHEYCI